MEYPVTAIINYFSEAELQFVDLVKNTTSSKHSNHSGLTSIDCGNLIFTLQGKATVIIDNESYILEPGIGLHVGPHSKLRVSHDPNEPWQYGTLKYRINQDSVEQHPIYMQHFSIKVGQHKPFASYIHELADRYMSAHPLTSIHAKVIFYQLIESMLSSIQKNMTSQKSELMLQAVQYMHLSYKEPLSVTQISKHIGVERRRFAYLFERYTGMTPNHYLTTFRMKRSRELLRIDQYTVAEVAELVGYHDSFYFSRVFKKYNGLSPSDYRKQLNIS